MHDQPIVLTKAKFGYLLSYEADQVIGSLVRARGEFEEGEIGRALSFLDRAGCPSSMKTFVDVGANIGTHMLWALTNGFSDAICIEPDEANFRLLRAMQILNGVDGVCRNVRVAVSSDDGDGLLELSDTNFGDHRIRGTPISEAREDYGETERATSLTSMKRLDTIFRELNVVPGDVGFIWIDTQGHEGQVLAGASTIRENRGIMPVVTEFWPYGVKRCSGYKLYRDAVEASGRQIYDLKKSIAPDRLSPMRLDELDAYYQNAVTREFTDLILI